jgi:hypothetical protein
MSTALRNIPEPQRRAVANRRAGSEAPGIGRNGARDYLDTIERIAFEKRRKKARGPQEQKA